MSSRARSAKSRRARELDLAFGVTLFLVTFVAFYVAGGGPARGADPTYVIIFGLLAVAAWWWAIRAIRARTAAGKTLEEIKALRPEQFEEWVAARLRDLGYKVKVTGTGGDHGVDLIAEKQNELAVVQCKNYRVYSVGEPILRDLYGAMHDFKASRAYLATTGNLTQPALSWVQGKPITVWDGAYIAKLSLQLAKAPKTNPGAVLGSAPAPSAQLAPAVSDAPVAAAGPAPQTKPACPKCGSALVERSSRRTGGSFLACPGYPVCKYTQPLPQ